ncbi:MAG: PAS domain-containing sensor histidine kinase [Alphaproteobacteria bacterium]|nr:PAS domain-containing sensor histidine kinase [Alphaproteobacteria bacterium]
MTQVFPQRTVGEQGRVYSRRPQTEQPDAAMALTDTIEPKVFRDLDVGELLLKQFGPVYVADANFDLLYATEGFIELARDAWGFKVDLSDNAAAPTPLRNVLEGLAETGRFEPIHTEVRRSGMTRLYLGRHFISEREQGRLFYGYFEDVTRNTTLEKKLAETVEKLNDTIRASSDWVWETDAELRLTEVSPRIAAITGVPPHMHLGKHVLSLGELPDTASGTPDLESLFANHRSFRNRLFIMRDEAGQPRRIHLSGMAFFDKSNGTFLGFRGTGTDITRTLEAERAMMSARQELEQALKTLEVRNDQLSDALTQAQGASKAKSEFLALTSHELRTPLNAIIGFTELCRRQVAGPITERMGDYLDNVLSASGHLVQIIDNLLDTVRIENDTTEIELQRLGVADLLRDTMTMIEVRAQTSGLTLQIPDVDDDIEVLADVTAARQILINLLTNAVKFTPEGGTVGIDIAEAQDDTVEITVWDTGIGIPADRMHAVFERFHRVRSDAFTTNTEGVGIGLHVARNLAQLMGGDISLESELGKGSRFTVTLPRWQAS